MMLGQRTNVKLLVSRIGSNYSVVDLDSGLVHPISGMTEGMQVLADDEGFWAAAGGGRPQYFAAPYDRDARRFDDLPDEGGNLFESVTTGRAWFVSHGSEPQAREIDSAGAITAGPLPIPLYGPAFAVDDGLVVGLRGGIYVINVDDGSQRRIGTGEAIAAKGSLVAAISCDDIAVCSLQVINIETEQARTLDVPGVDFNYRYYMATFSPDGAMLVLVGNTPTPNGAVPVGVVVIDVEQESVVPIGIGAKQQISCCGLPVLWSFDSQWLFSAGGDVVYAWQRGTDEPISFSPGRPPFMSVTVVG